MSEDGLLDMDTLMAAPLPSTTPISMSQPPLDIAEYRHLLQNLKHQNQGQSAIPMPGTSANTGDGEIGGPPQSHRSHADKRALLNSRKQHFQTLPSKRTGIPTASSTIASPRQSTAPSQNFKSRTSTLGAALPPLNSSLIDHAVNNGNNANSLGSVQSPATVNSALSAPVNIRARTGSAIGFDHNDPALSRASPSPSPTFPSQPQPKFAQPSPRRATYQAPMTMPSGSPPASRPTSSIGRQVGESFSLSSSPPPSMRISSQLLSPRRLTLTAEVNSLQQQFEALSQQWKEQKESASSPSPSPRAAKTSSMIHQPSQSSSSLTLQPFANDQNASFSHSSSHAGDVTANSTLRRQQRVQSNSLQSQFAALPLAGGRSSSFNNSSGHPLVLAYDTVAGRSTSSSLPLAPTNSTSSGAGYGHQPAHSLDDDVIDSLSASFAYETGLLDDDELLS